MISMNIKVIINWYTHFTSHYTQRKQRNRYEEKESYIIDGHISVCVLFVYTMITLNTRLRTNKILLDNSIHYTQHVKEIMYRIHSLRFVKIIIPLGERDQLYFHFLLFSRSFKSLTFTKPLLISLLILFNFIFLYLYILYCSSCWITCITEFDEDSFVL